MAKIYFIDDFILDRRINAERYFFKFQPASKLFFDPEGHVSYASLNYDKQLELYRCWYNRTTSVKNDCTCLELMESEDGEKWRLRKNSLWGLGSSHRLDLHGAGVYLDERDRKNGRYKLAASKIVEDSISNIIAVSEDGISWTIREDAGWGNDCKSDTLNSMIYNPVMDCYQVFFRAVNGDRRIAMQRSRDLKNWSRPELVLTPTPLDKPGCQFYGMAPSYIDGMFWGTLWIFYTDMFDPVRYKMNGYVRSELVYSYDGIHWIRTFHELLSLPEPGDYGFGGGYMGNFIKKGSSFLSVVSLGLFQHGLYKNDNDEVVLHGTRKFKRSSFENKFNKKNSGIRFFDIRLDGLAGLSLFGTTPPKMGNILLKPITLLSNYLTLNANAENGGIKVQLLDVRNCKVIPGFSFDDSIPLEENNTNWEVKWKNRALNELSTRNIMIEIKGIGGAIIYSIECDYKSFTKWNSLNFDVN